MSQQYSEEAFHKLLRDLFDDESTKVKEIKRSVNEQNRKKRQNRFKLPKDFKKKG